MLSAIVDDRSPYFAKITKKLDDFFDSPDTATGTVITTFFILCSLCVITPIYVIYLIIVYSFKGNKNGN